MKKTDTNTILDGRDVVLYHANCADGLGAATAAFARLYDRAIYQGVSYGGIAPDLTGARDVYIVDFSYGRETLLQMADSITGELVVLDHHKTAQKDLEGWEHGRQNLHVRFHLEKSGAVLAWQHFHPSKPVPELLLYVQDRDLWRWELPDSAEINTAIWFYLTWEVGAWSDAIRRWDKLKPQLVNGGTFALAYRDRLIERLVYRPGSIVIGALKVMAVNSPILQSEIAHALLTVHPDEELVAVYSDIPDTCDISVSLRSREGGIDVGEIAKAFGGGGHPCAAGLRLRDFRPAFAPQPLPEIPAVSIAQPSKPTTAQA